MSGTQADDNSPAAPKHSIPAEVIVFLLGSLLALAGCQHATMPATGRSSFRIVDPPADTAKPAASSNAELAKSLSYRDAQAIQPLATPVYPPAALAAKVGLTIVGVHVTVGPDGRVSDVAPSILAISIPTRFDVEFQAAVRAALAQWRFNPAETFEFETVPLLGGGSYRRRVSAEKVAATFDIAFTFTADGKVLGAP